MGGVSVVHAKTRTDLNEVAAYDEELRSMARGQNEIHLFDKEAAGGVSPWVIMAQLDPSLR